MAENLEGFKPFMAGQAGTRAGDRTVGIVKSGKLSMTTAVHDALGSGHVLLLWDEQGRRLAVKACSPDTPGAYPVRKMAKQNTWYVSLMALLGYYGVKVKETRRYPVRINDGVFVVNLADNLQDV